MNPSVDNTMQEIEDLIQVASKRLISTLQGYDLSKEQQRFVYDFFALQHPLHIIETCIQKGVVLRKPDQLSAGPLWTACQSRHYKLIKRIIELGADVNEVSSVRPLEGCLGKTPLDDLADDYHCVNSTAEREAIDSLWDYLKSLGAKYPSELGLYP